MSDCIICRSPKRTQITCEYCEFCACAACCEQYLLTRTTPTCMAPECKREWTRKFMAKNFTKVFMNKKYKSHKENIIAEQQIALLPATQPEIIRIQNLETIQREIDLYDTEIRKLYALKLNKRNEYLVVKHRRESVQRERREFVRHCPADNCKGFLSSQWKCGICNIWCCPTCHEIKGLDKNIEHECNPNTVETVREIGNTSKNCPKCYIPIFKIEGCDQMWCTLCEVYFSWRTGEIDTSGRYHNPHALEALRRRNREGVPRAPGDIMCGRELNYEIVRTIETRLSRIIRNTNLSHLSPEDKTFLRDWSKNIPSLIRKIIHIRGVDMQSYRVNIDQQNLQLRIDYMMNKIDLNDFKYKLQCLNKKYMKSHEIYQVFDMFVVSTTDIIYRFMDYIESIETIEDSSYSILGEITPICEFANECFDDIQAAYGGVIPKIGANLKVVKDRGDVKAAVATPPTEGHTAESISGGGGGGAVGTSSSGSV